MALLISGKGKPLSPELRAACDAVWDGLRGHCFSYHANARPPKKPANWK